MRQSNRAIITQITVMELNHHRLEAGGFDWRLEAA